MKRFAAVAAITLALTSTAHAEDMIKFAFKETDLATMIETYAKASGKKFVVDPIVRGKATIHLSEPVSLDEAYNLLSSALAANGFAISEREDVAYVGNARNVQRDSTPMYKELPPLKPMRMATLVYQLKYADCHEVNNRLRIFSSRDGEMAPFEPSNQLIISDWTPNLVRIHKILEEIDKPETKDFRPNERAVILDGPPRLKGH